MILHPLFAYPTMILAFIVFPLYIIALLKLKNLLRLALYANGLLIIFALLAVVFGFGVANIPLVQSKTPLIWGFPHKWNGIMLLIFSAFAFILFWFKGESASKGLVIIPIIGLLMTLFQIFTGWMLRLVFFS
ncbi:MAG: hypothetical protein NZ851_03505 [Aquificaceae bacterium]|nr:hypothetical protein [Aquificaceae bacterium]